MRELLDYHLNPVFTGAVKEKLYISSLWHKPKTRTAINWTKMLDEALLRCWKTIHCSWLSNRTCFVLAWTSCCSFYKTKFFQCLVGIYVAQCSMVRLQDLNDNLGIWHWLVALGTTVIAKRSCVRLYSIKGIKSQLKNTWQLCDRCISQSLGCWILK